MSLRDRLQDRINLTSPEIQEQKEEIKEEAIIEQESENVTSNEFINLKDQIHLLLIEKINSTPTWFNYDIQQQTTLIKQFIENQLLNKFKVINLDKKAKEELINSIIKDEQGFGPLEDLFSDNSISGIFINGIKQVFIEKNGKISKTNIEFKSSEHLTNIINILILQTGEKIDKTSTIVDVRLPNGSRLNAIFPPLAINGPSLVIRKSKKENLGLQDLLENNFFTNEIMQTLFAAVKAKLNIIISTDAASDKTSLLTLLASQIPDEERIITIEDFPELVLKQENILKLETNRNKMVSEISTKDVILNAFKMRPDRIIFDECQGTETAYLIQALNACFTGSLIGLCANSTKNALSKLETMCTFETNNLNENIVKSKIASAIDLIVQINTLADGTSKITSVSEIVGMEENDIAFNEIFKFDPDNSKTSCGHFSTGIKPKFLDKYKEKNSSIPSEYFNKTRKHSYTTEDNIQNDKDSGIKDKIIQNTNNLFSQRFKK